MKDRMVTIFVYNLDRETAQQVALASITALSDFETSVHVGPMIDEH